jgi:hypothetical protein
MAFLPANHLLDDLKASSIVLTGAFGILGLVKDFKDKKGKITKWGRISLAGILLSTGVGVVTQIMESSKAQHADELAQQKEKETAAQTLRIVQDIERGLSPLDEPTFDVRFSLDCTNLAYGYGYGSFCNKIKSLVHPPSTDERHKLWEFWPGGDKVTLFLEIYFFADPKDAQLFMNGQKEEADLYFELKPTSRDDSLLFWYGDNWNRKEGEVELSAYNIKPDDYLSNGKLKSVLDLNGVTVVMQEITGDTDVRKLLYFRLKLRNGQTFIRNEPFDKVQVKGYSGFRFVLPAPLGTSSLETH